MRIVFFFLCISLSASSQNFLVVNGILVDSISQNRVPSANIHIKSYPYSGTFSNEVGEFKFQFGDSLRMDTLVISVIGYKTKFLPVNGLLKGVNNTQLISLSPSVALLNEVTISSTRDFAGELIAKAFKNLDKNITKKKHVIEAFYRELAIRDSTYVRLIEAAISIQDYGYGSSLDRRKIKVIELRKSEDYLTYGFGAKFVKLLFGEDNKLYTTIDSDFPRRFKDHPKLTLIDDENFLDQYAFTFEAYTTIDSDSVAIVSFHSDKQNFNRPFYEGKAFIKLTDYAIIRFEFGMVANPEMTIRNQNQIYYQGKFFFLASVEYRKIEDKYYLSRVKMTKPVNFDAIEKTSGQQYATYDLMAIEFHTKNSDFERIRLRDSQKRDEDLYKQDFIYNPEFWEHFNYVKLNPLLKKAKIDLEKAKELEHQFEKDND
jgi:CarboxypepD_reg-like domain